MTDEEKTLNSLLNTLGVPVAYMLFREPKPLPFIIYRGAGTFNLEADNVVSTAVRNTPLNSTMKARMLNWKRGWKRC